jgi:protein transport protein SEC24
MAIEFSESQVCADLFLTSQNYLDIASLSVVPRTTGGQIYFYHGFQSSVDSAKLYNDLRWNLTRPQGLEAIMRVRCSKGLQLQEYYGNFWKRNPTEVELPAVGLAVVYH